MRPAILRISLAALLLAGGVGVSQLPGSPLRIAGHQNFTVEVFNGFKDKTLPWNTSVVRREDGSVYANARMVMTVTKPDSATVVFEQLTDGDGHVRGQLYGSVVDQTGTYGLKAQMAGGGTAATGSFRIADSADPAANTTYTGNNTFTGTTTFTQPIQANGGVDTNGAAITTDNGNINAGTGTVTAGTFSGGLLRVNNVQSGLGAGMNATPVLVKSDSAGRGIRLFTGDYDDATTGSLFSIGMGAGTGNTYTSLDSYTAGGSAAGNIIMAGNVSANVGFGEYNPTSKIHLASSTSAIGGIGFGSDVNLYRSAADNLKTDDTLTIGGSQLNFSGNGAVVVQNQAVDSNASFATGLAGETTPKFSVWAGGQLNWGPGGTSAMDTNLYRGGADRLQTDDYFLIQRATGTSDALAVVNQAAGGAATFYVRADGTLQFGSGAGAQDVNLFRSAADVLRTDDSLEAGGSLTLGSGTTTVLSQWNTTNGNASLNHGLVLDTGGTGSNGLYFGPSADTNLYRAAANTLQTDDVFYSVKSSGAEIALGVITSGSAYPSWWTRANGNMEWGDGTAAPDTLLTRAGAGQLQTNGEIRSVRASDGAGFATINSTLGGWGTWYVTNNGGQWFGSGAGAQDTNLYRGAADELKTDDSFFAAGAYLTFSTNIRGINIAIASGATSVAVTFPTGHPDANYAVQCTPTYNTTCYVTNKTTTGFTINFGTAAPDANQKVDWLVVR